MLFNETLSFEIEYSSEADAGASLSRRLERLRIETFYGDDEALLKRSNGI